MLTDIGMFIATVAARAGLRLARKTRRSWQLHRRLRGTRGLTGTVESLGPLRAPLSGVAVPAYRLTVLRRLDDGSWDLYSDETRCGELAIRSDEGPVRIGGPLDLLLPPSQEAMGWALADAGLALPGDEEDVRVLEYLLQPGQQVHLLGLCTPRSRRNPGAPYREPPARADHRWQGRPLISHWSARELLRLLWHDPERLPPDLWGLGR